MKLRNWLNARATTQKRRPADVKQNDPGEVEAAFGECAPSSGLTNRRVRQTPASAPRGGVLFGEEEQRQQRAESGTIATVVRRSS